MGAGEILKVNSLSRNFGGIAAVSALSFEIEKNSISGIIGPNGAGKTTVFNLITGVYKPTAGEIFFDGKPISNLRPDSIVRLGISRTFQNIRLFKRLTCVENVLCPIKQRNELGGKAALGEAMGLLSVMGLDDYADARAANLSYGLQRKLEIARALAAKPKLLLLDEPAAGMNPEETRALVDLISEIREKFNLTILLIEHHMDLIMKICSHIVVMESGSLLFEGTPDEVRKNEKVVEAYLGRKKHA